MKRDSSKHRWAALIVSGSAFALGGCNSHPLVQPGKPTIVVVNPDGSETDASTSEDAGAPDAPADTPLYGSDGTRPDGEADRPAANDVADAHLTDARDASPDQGIVWDAGAGLELLSWYQSAGGTPVRVLKRGQYVYLADWDNRALASNDDGIIQVYDVTDPSHPAGGAALYTAPHQIQDLAIEGIWLFAANDALGVLLADRSPPGLKYLSNRSNGGLFATSVAATTRRESGVDQLYLFAGYLYGGGMDIHAVPSGGPVPAPILQYRSTELPDRCDVNQIQIRGDQAYILAADGESRACLEILDIARLPAASTVLGRLCFSYADFGGIGDLWPEGDLVFFAASDYRGSTHVGGLRIFDVKDHKKPTLLSSLDLPAVGEIPWKGSGLAVSGNQVFFITSSGVQVIDVSQPSTPVAGAFAPFPPPFGVCQGGTAVVDGDFIYVGAYCKQTKGRGGLAIYRRR